MAQKRWIIVLASSFLIACSGNPQNAVYPPKIASLADDSLGTGDVALIDIAADNSNHANDSMGPRWAAVDKLSEAGRRKLRLRLLDQITKNFPHADTSDLLIIGNIGDEQTAEELENLYPDMPNMEPFLHDSMDLHTAVASIRNRLGTHAWDIVDDSLADIRERLTAVSRLTESERVRLQSLLMRRIPLSYSLARDNTDDIRVLGEVGDERAAEWLETIPGPFKIGEFISAAVDRIRARASTKGK